jgi:hypothetical protein
MVAEMDVDERPHSIMGKRGRSDAKYAFYARFPSGVVLKSWVSGIASILHECTFHVTVDGGFSGFSVESIDTPRVCMIQSRLPVCAIEGSATQFCLRLSNLILCLKNCGASQVVDVWVLEECCDVYVATFEPGAVGGFNQVHKIKSIERVDPEYAINDMKHDIFVELDVATFKTVIRCAKEHRVKEMQMSVYLSRKDDGCAIFVMDYCGDEVSGRVSFGCQGPHDYKSTGTLTMSLANGTEPVPSDMDEEQFERLFAQTFSVEYLTLFANVGERSPVLLRLSAGLPLFMEIPYSNGGFTRFVLAQNV